MSGRFTFTTDQEFGDSFLDISNTERRLIRVTTQTYEATGTYIFLKLFKMGSDGEFHIDQRIILNATEFQALINKSEIINMGPQHLKECVVGILKRPEKHKIATGVSKFKKLSPSSTIGMRLYESYNLHYFRLTFCLLVFTKC